LQYGPQFGGMANYILKNGSDINKPFEFESIQTTGSNQLFSSYNAIGGRTNSMNYYSFFDHRNGNGWRQNSRYFSNAGFGVVSFAINNKASISAEVMISHSRSQQGGGLTESQFEENPKQSFRQRNWLDIVWITPAISYNYNVNNNTKWNTKLFATIGDRNSVGFIQPITIKDSINTNTNNFNNRTLNADKYRNVGIESRVISSYTFLKSKNTIAGGIRLYNGNTYRESNGKGSTGMDYDMTAINPHPNDIAFNSKNIAFFIENIFRINKILSIIPGCRFEWLEGTASGRNGYTSTGNPIYLQNIKKSRSFIISGIGAEYHVSKDVNVYSNITQAYRPIQFANLQAPPTTDKVDENLADAKGYNFDLGIKGKVKDIFQFDVSLFYLNYKNRIGTITPAGANYRLITNIGSSYSNGIESFFEVNPLKIFKINTSIEALLFTSYSLTIAKYKSDYKDGLIKGNDVENVPRHILRTGVSVIYKSILLSTQFSYTDKVFSDANNTLMPSSNGQTGLIPAYKIWDATIGYKAINKTNFKLGINNLLNKNYFTRRAGGYPGPGVLPGDGRTFFISIATKI
jgi:Fe(3+) dicitrate transport protein